AVVVIGGQFGGVLAHSECVRNEVLDVNAARDIQGGRACFEDVSHANVWPEGHRARGSVLSWLRSRLRHVLHTTRTRIHNSRIFPRVWSVFWSECIPGGIKHGCHGVVVDRVADGAAV